METGQILSKFARLEAAEEIAYENMQSVGIPGECMDVISRAYAREIEKLEQEIGVTLDDLLNHLNKRGFNAKRIYDQAVGRIIWRYEND